MAMLVLGAAACSSDKDELSRSGARKAAERYYDYLLQDDYESYVNGFLGADSMPQELRSQMVDLMVQYMADQKSKGLCDVVATEAELQDSNAYVFLEMLYADSLREQIGVPVVFHDGRWQLR